LAAAAAAVRDGMVRVEYCLADKLALNLAFYARVCLVAEDNNNKKILASYGGHFL